MAMTVMVELRVSSPRSEHLIHHIHAVDPRRLLVETNVCRLLAPRHRVHEGLPHNNVHARAVHERITQHSVAETSKKF